MEYTTLKKPKASKHTKTLKEFNEVRIDNYYWLKERKNKNVINYLKEENRYFKELTAHTKDLQNNLFAEMKGRIKEEDESLPYLENKYFYITRFKKGNQYPIFIRKKETLNNKEELLFDVNKMAKNFEYFKLGSISISPNNKLAVYSEDITGRRQYTLKIKNLYNGNIHSDIIKNTTGTAVWANDNATIFYTKKNIKTLRSERVFKHVLGTESKEDIEVYYEEDDTFNTFITKSKSKKYLIIGSYSTLSTEYRILDANIPNGEFKIFQKRQKDLEYSIAHYKNLFYILTNKDKATNFKIMKTLESETNIDKWENVIAHREDTLIEDFTIFKDYLVIEERTNGLNKIRIKKWDSNEDYYIPFQEETYSAFVLANPEFDTKILRYGYDSLTTPSSIIDYNLENKTSQVKKEEEVLGGKFSKENYKSKRLWATAVDGAKIPISLVYRKDTLLNKNTPLILYGYGSYGYTIDDSFSSIRLSLLDRGFVYAIAHIRGSEYLGREWYDTGKLLHKKNTFTDFIDCAKYLIKKNYTSSKHLYAKGGSAGGLLMGAIANMNPEIFNGIIASVPFVDVLTTMLDENIPLTTGEYDEWGNPNNKEYYDYIKSYSPYDNVEAKAYPNILVTTGLNDSQVQYWEPAKWVAKLRELKTDNNKLLMHTNMDAGHGGASGRFDSLKETAIDYSFLLDLEKINS